MHPNFLFLMRSHHFLQMCGNWPTPSGVQCKLVTTHLSMLCWHQTYLYCHPFLSVGAVFCFSLFVFLYYCEFLCAWVRACYSEHSLLQLLVCGTVFYHTSLLSPLSPSAVVWTHISSHFLIPLSGDSSLICTVPKQWLVMLDTNCFYI